MFQLKEDIRKKIMYTVGSMVILAILAILLLSCARPLEISISFDSNGGSDVTSVILIEDEVFNLPSDPVRAGYTFKGWYLEESLTTPFTVEAALLLELETLEVFASWQINRYTLTFNSNEGSVVDSITKDFNASVTAPNNPIRVGYTFDGWYNDQALSARYTFSTMPANNQTLYAKWLINPYTITFNSNGGSSLSNETYDYNETVVAPNIPLREGYTFDGWYADESLNTKYVFDTMPASNLNLYAKWTIKTLTMSFESNGGSSVLPITSEFESQVLAPESPTKVGHTFKGWYKEASLSTIYTFPNMMTSENITLYAKFDVNPYQIHILSEGFVTFKEVVTGNAFSAGISTSGDVYTWGFGGGGRLGTGNTVNMLTPVKVNLPLLEGETPSSLYLTQHGVTVLTSHNRVMGWGGTADYNLQLNGQFNLSPVVLAMNLNPSEIILDMLNTSDAGVMLALTNMRLLAWGRNTNGQVGLPARTSAPVQYESIQEVPLTFLEDNETITKIYGNSSVTLLLTDKGSVYFSGTFLSTGLTSNTFTKVNIDVLNPNESIKDILLSQNYVVYLTTENRLIGIGIGIGDGTDTFYNTYQVLNYNLLPNETIVTLRGGFRSSSFLTSLGHFYTLGEGYATGSGISDGTTKVLSPVNITQRLALEPEDVILSFSSGNGGGVISTKNGYLISYGNGFGSATGLTTNLASPVKASRIPGVTDLLSPMTVLYNETIVLPTPPVKNGYVFEGWYSDSAYTIPFTMTTMPANGITIYGKYNAS